MSSKDNKKGKDQKKIIYVLELKDDKYYVGKTDNLAQTILDHFNKSDCEWTKKYPPKNILKEIPQENETHEHKETLRMMRIKGLWNVRGSIYKKLLLTEKDRKGIKEDLHMNANQCYFCASMDHHTKYCPKKEFDETNKEFSKGACYRCGRQGHLKNQCFSHTNIWGEYISSHEENESEGEEGEEVSEEENGIFFCSRCGRKGHLKRDCYATRTVDKIPLN